VKAFLLALSFLTIIPAYNKAAGEKEMADSLYFYPVVGFVIGGILVVISEIGRYLPLGLGADALIIAAWIVLTGGLHLDGLMDTADGLFSGKERQRKLEIMRDSRVGAMGVISLTVVLLLKFSFVAAFPYPDRIWVLLLAPVVGRCVMVYAISFYPYAREGSGLGRCFGENAGKNKFFAALTILLLGALAAGAGKALLFALAAVLLSMVIVKHIAGILGGLTGDTYGAVSEIAEAIFLIISLAGMAGYYAGYYII